MKRLAPISRVMVVGFLACGGGSVWAGQIMVLNNQFQTLPSSGLSSCGVGCGYSFAAIADWSASGSGEAGIIQPGTQNGDPNLYGNLPNGATDVGVTYGPTLSQTLNTTVVAGMSYTLTVSIGSMANFPSAESADLLVNGVQYMATGTQPAPGNWSTLTLTYVGLQADMGDAITIQLNDPNAGDAAGFTNIQMSSSGAVASIAPNTSAVPEPGVLGSVGMACLCLVAFKRKLAFRTSTSSS